MVEAGTAGTAGQTHQAIAARLIEAARTRRPVPPIRDDLGEGDVAAAYAVQDLLTGHALAAGRRLIGRKIGLTSPVVQAQLGVDQPDYGALFADMVVPDGGTLARDDLIAPRVEAEIVFVLGRDLPGLDTGAAQAAQAVDHVLAALEIVDSRIEGWRIGLVDTIADNASCGRIVLGTAPRRLGEVDLEACAMAMTKNGEAASHGAGRDCMGSPLNALAWLARTMAGLGQPLRAGQIVLSGALGPMVAAAAGDRFEARIEGFDPVGVGFV